MTDILVDKPPRKRISRHHLLQGVVASGVAALAAKVGFSTLPHDNLYEIEEGRRKQTTDKQKEAYATLLRTSPTQKETYIVKDNEDIRKKGGVAFRDEPKTPLQKDDRANFIRTIPVGTVIKNAISWQGIDPYDPAGKRHSMWIAFQDENGIVGFVYEGNLERAKPGYSK